MLRRGSSVVDAGGAPRLRRRRTRVPAGFFWDFFPGLRCLASGPATHLRADRATAGSCGAGGAPMRRAAAP